MACDGEEDAKGSPALGGTRVDCENGNDGQSDFGG